MQTGGTKARLRILERTLPLFPSGAVRHCFASTQRFFLPSLSSNGEWAAHLGGNEQVTATEKVSWLPSYFFLRLHNFFMTSGEGEVPIPPFYTHPLSHMIHGRSSPNNLFSSAFSVFAVCARRGTGQYESLHSDFMGWIFCELMNILSFTLESVKTLVLCKLWTHLNFYPADYSCQSYNNDYFH